MRKVLYMMGILDDSDVEWLGKNGKTQFISPGTVLIHEGSAVEDVYVVLEGKLSVVVKATSDRQIAGLLAGEIVGEISFIDSRPPSASVVAAQDSQLLVVSRSVLTSKLRGDAAFAARFYRAVAVLLADRLRQTTSHLGYGKWTEKAEPDELDEPLMDCACVGTTRFDRLLKQLRIH
jgi:CRP-like cAMP-binding protein